MAIAGVKSEILLTTKNNLSMSKITNSHEGYVAYKAKGSRIKLENIELSKHQTITNLDC